MYSCSLSGLDKQQQQQRQGSGGGDKAAESFQFAPRDVTPWQAEGKDNLHGIGYSGMEGLGVLAGRQTTGALYGMSGEVCVCVCFPFPFSIIFGAVLLTGRCYEAEICVILLLLRCILFSKLF